MKNASLITTIIALLVGVAGGYLLGNKSVSSEGSANENKTVNVISSTGPGSANRSGTASTNASGDEASTTASVDGSLSAEAKRLFDSGDVAGALKAILNAPGQMGRMEALLGFVKDLDAEGVEAALPFIRGMGRGGDQFMSMGLLMGRYAEIDPERALAYVGKQGGMERGFGTSSILRTWAASDPRAAADYLTNNVIGSGGDDWMLRRTAGSLASEWAKQDPQAALVWANTLSDEMKGDAMNNIVEQLTSQDPLEAAKVAMGFDGEQRERSLRTIADQWSRNEPEEAVKWAESLTVEGKTQALEEAVESWVGKDTDAAVAYMAKMDQGERDEIMKEVIEQWGRKGAESQPEAAEWVAAQPDGEGKVEATGEIVGQWMRPDAESASGWLNDQPEGDAKDRGITALLRDRSVREDPEAAVAWADSISNSEMRSEQVSRSARSWLASDRASALEYLEQSNSLSAEQKTELINIPQEELQRGGGDDRRRRGRPF